MKRAILLLPFLALVGCNQSPPKPDMPISEVHPTPVCEGASQCSEMWGRAIEGVTMVTGMKVMSANETFIQTFPSRKVGYLNGRVYKQSLGGEKYEIKGTFDCLPYDWCNNFRNKTQSAFNIYVQGYIPLKK
ncbi:hypothetical protein [Pseudomonas aeruginosa]|uniref:hypothetical protein n=1 Tax=Pseudomonas aeruginosa TaxID=287 RepID=UPI000F89887A|nr:hypothetical protein [Pseudomonas aeruginosa]RUG63112.1 hypothetical protein IPC748_27825 [Pseudomonas aeruginosa]WCW70551.1 hypothetical protein KK219_24575 [Pseudomonas aeruginosa]HEJ3833673.1 hypothetical protein [Pseudomonas aeruginosa]HEJ4767134.1 hypothetical protein [Pseudomonas aeruginosa]